ncbi:MAG TPA: response regulator transcription factor [Thermoanaerobaculia bacterium]|nr:response regulator transcription factor [Thermoanaerobaculia bacterium]
MTHPIRVLIVDDHSVIRHGLRSLFSAHRDIEVVGEADDVETAITLGSSTACDVATVDLRLHGRSGIDVIQELARTQPGCKAVVLTNYGSDTDVDRALAAGAQGYVMKYADAAEIVGAVRTVHSGRRYLSAETQTTLAESAHWTRLTAREQQVLEHLVHGARNRAIARALQITEETVKGHIKRILVKLGVSDRTEAATSAIRRGLVRVD